MKIYSLKQALWNGFLSKKPHCCADHMELSFCGLSSLLHLTNKTDSAVIKVDFSYICKALISMLMISTFKTFL